MNADDFNVDRATNDILNQRTRWVAQAAESRRKLLTAWPRLVGILRLLPNPTLYMYTDDLRVQISLPSFKLAEPMLTSLQEATAAEFNRTEDNAQSGTRTYTLKDFPFSLVVSVAENDETAACRRVVVGEQIVPVYELRCDDDAPPSSEEPL